MKTLVKTQSSEGLWMEEAEAPKPGPNDVLIRVKKTAICGTDLHMVLDGWGTPDHPDISGAVLAKLIAFLKSPLGAHVKGVFVDCAPPPRSPPHRPAALAP